MHVASKLAPKRILAIAAVGAWLAVMTGAARPRSSWRSPARCRWAPSCRRCSAPTADRRRRGGHHRRRRERRAQHPSRPPPPPGVRMKRFTILALALALDPRRRRLAVRLLQARRARARRHRPGLRATRPRQRAPTGRYAGLTGTLLVFAIGAGLALAARDERPARSRRGRRQRRSTACDPRAKLLGLSAVTVIAVSTTAWPVHAACARRAGARRRARAHIGPRTILAPRADRRASPVLLVAAFSPEIARAKALIGTLLRRPARRDDELPGRAARARTAEGARACSC